MLKNLKKISPILPSGDEIIRCLEGVQDKPTEDFILKSCKELKRITEELNNIIKTYQNDIS